MRRLEKAGWRRRGVRMGGAALLFVVACSPAGEQGGAGSDPASTARQTAGYVRPSAEAPDLTSGDTIPESPSWTRQDWEILDETSRWAWREGIDRLPIGERIARIGERFVGTAYVPQTLDPPGPERLVVNLRALDCVTYVEAMMSLAHFVRRASPEILDRPEDARALYETILTSIRYRSGSLNGYASRLHYFTEWLWDNDGKGFVRNLSRELGGVRDEAPIDFMTSHPDAYHQLEERETLESIAEVERRLSARPRFYVPQDLVKTIEHEIRTGDVIAATSTLDGLDIAHTGIALWKDGVLHLMHAPLVGEAVQISEASLADRLLDLTAQDGIMIARPMDSMPEE